MPTDVLLGKDHLVIAEIAQAHDGNFDAAVQLVEAAARAGAHVVKFQTHLAAAESTAREPWRVRFSSRDSTRQAYWRRMEFSLGQWKSLKSRCDELGVEFMSSPFSVEAVDLLMDVGVRMWKVASGEVANRQLLERLSATRLPTILSSGLSTYKELGSAIDILGLPKTDLAVLQCSTQYPTVAERVGLNVLAEYRSLFDCVVGISDHTATIYSAIAAAALGAQIFEIHLRQDQDLSGPDASSSLTEGALAELVRGVSFVRTALSNPVSKAELTADQLQLRAIFGRSLVAARPLSTGEIVTSNDVAFKKPGGGLSYDDIVNVVGRRLRRNLNQDDELRMDDFQ